MLLKKILLKIKDICNQKVTFLSYNKKKKGDIMKISEIEKAKIKKLKKSKATSWMI